MRLFKLDKFIIFFTLAFLYSEAHSLSWIQDQKLCTPPGYDADYDVLCTWERVQEYNFDNAAEAEAACNEWLAGITEPDETCHGSNIEPKFEGGWTDWPLCTPSSCPEYHLWLGDFYYPICSNPDPILGCLQEDNPNKCEVPVNIGNPLNIAIGSKLHSEGLDVGNSDLDIKLNYTSDYLYDRAGIPVLSALAPGWSHSYYMSVSPIFYGVGVEFVEVRRPDGRRARFNKNNGQWVADLPNEELLFETPSGWEYLSNLGKEIYEFQNGNIGHAVLKSIEFYDGKILTFTHSGTIPAFVNKIENQFGDYVLFKSIDTVAVPGHRIYQIQHSDGRIWNLSYDDAGPNANHNLIAITYPDQTIKYFYYEDQNNHPYALTGISRRFDPNDLDPNHPTTPVTEADMRFATYVYDSERRVTKEWHHAKDLQGNDIKVEELDILYNADNTRTITNSRSEISTYTVEKNNGLWQIKSIVGPGCSSCSNDNTDFVYDANNNLSSKTQDGVTTVFGDYDSKGQYGYKIEASGTIDAKRTDYSYDPRFIGKITSITEDSVFGTSDKVTSYVYNDDGQMTSMTVNGFKPDGTAISQTTVYEYNGPFNQISRIDGPRAGNIDETTYIYYPDDHLEEHWRNRLEKVIGPEGIVEKDKTEWSATGKILYQKRPNGITITNSYNPLTDQLDTMTQSDGVKFLVTKFTYEATGRIKTVTQNHGTPEASTMTLTYDGALRVTRVTDQLGNYIEYTLDTEGNQEAEKTYDPQGNLKKQITQVFDPYDMVDSMTQSGVTIDYNYSSNGVLDNQVNGNKVTTDYSYDNLKRLSQINQDYQGSNPATANTITSFSYDEGDRVETVTDARGNITTYSYDDLGNLITLNSPDTGITSYSYDSAGNMLSKTDANGVTVTMTYDGRSRITAIDYADNTLDMTYVYDQGVNGIGQLSSMTDQTGSTVFTYDAFGNLLDKAQVVTGFDAATYQGFNDINSTYTYDANNRVNTLTYPSGLTLAYDYDDLNQVVKISTTIDGQAEVVADQVQYLPFGPIKSIKFGNGKNYGASYDDGYRLIDYSYGADISAVYSYDKNHNITGISREVVNHNDGFSYDELDRLTDDSHGPIILTYDKLGNRTSYQYGRQPTVDYTIDNNSNKLTKIGNHNERDYDANGNNIAQSEVAGYKWIYNQTNRMSQFSVDKIIRGQYYYNALGQRVHKTKFKPSGSLAGEHIFLFDQQGQLLHESKYKNNFHIWDRETIWLGNRPIARVETRYSNGMVSSQDIYYIQTDHLHTPRWITDDAGTRIWSWESDAFGTTPANIDVDGDGINFYFNMRFPGQFYDNESGIHYNYFRDYEPGTGRYVQSDPIGLGGGVNTYSYVEGTPLLKVDRYGLNSIALNWGIRLTGGALCAVPIPGARVLGVGMIASTLGGDTCKSCGDKWMCTGPAYYEIIGQNKHVVQGPNFTAYGKTQAIAAHNWKKLVQSSAPPGHTARHIKPKCKKIK